VTFDACDDDRKEALWQLAQQITWGTAPVLRVAAYQELVQFLVTMVASQLDVLMRQTAVMETTRARCGALDAENADLTARLTTSEAFQSGYAKGFEVGWDHGYAEGEEVSTQYQEGFSSGYAKGHNAAMVVLLREQEN
jgi:hypothetical protein